MRTFDVRHCVMVAGAWLIAGSVWAADTTLFDSIPADRNTVVVVNVPVVLGSSAWKSVEGNVNLSKLNDNLAQLEQWTGFNLRRDLRKIVVGKFNGRDAQDVVLLQGTFDQGRILDALRQNPQYTSLSHKSATIHSWYDDNEQRLKYAAFLQGDLIVIGTEDGVKGVLDARSDPKTSFGARPEVRSVLRGVSQEAPICAVACKSGAGALQQVPALLATIALDGDFKMNVSAEAADDVAAQHLSTMAGGLIAFGKLANDKPELRTLANGASVQTSGRSVTLAIVVPEKDFTPWLIQKIEEKQRRN